MERAASLLELLARSVQAHPGTAALIADGQPVTYAELWALVGRVTSALAARGLAGGDRVALIARNSVEYVAAYYAVMAAGGVVVPLNSEARARDLIAWITHCGARLALFDAAHAERPAVTAALGSAVDVVTLADAAGHAPRDPEASCGPAAAGHALASLLYTSGTTGQPKGVMLSHDNLVSNTLAVVKYLELDASDRVLSALPFFYSYGNSVLHTHLAVGATVVLGPGMMYPGRVVDAMRDERVTGFSGVPWMFSTLLARTRFASMRAELPALRYLTQAGAPMRATEIARITSALPDTRFFVMYGQTEATARLSYLPPAELSRRIGSVGLGIPGVQLEVRGLDGTRTTPGEVGEVHASGPNIMIGYWNAPDVTRGVIADEPSGRWLRTGDLGYLDERGFLYLVGRTAEMIKTGAHRVSPADIEDAVLRLDGVAEAAAFGQPDDSLGEVIEVAVVTRPDAHLSERDVLAHCRAELSLFKIPRRIVFLSSLPKTPSGKVQRRALAGLTQTEVPS